MSALDLPAFAEAARLRPVSVVQPGSTLPRAPYAAAETDVRGPAAQASLSSGSSVFRATWERGVVALEITTTAGTTRHVSRRHGRVSDVTSLAVSLTGPTVTAFVRTGSGASWTARAIVDLTQHESAPDVHDEGWLAGLAGDGDRAGTFGQLGLRDVRAVSRADGAAYHDDGRVLLTATSAGPAGFRSAHNSVWSFDPETLELAHRADLFFRRPERPGVFGDHASHLLLDDGEWLVAASTWGDFDRHTHPRVTTTLARLAGPAAPDGIRILDTTPLALPTAGLESVGRWDPHLVRTAEGWLVAFVSARRFFSFHPALAAGPDLDRLSLRSAARDRTATEGPILHRLGEQWLVLASDGRDNPRGRRAAYPVFDLDFVEQGAVRADYPSNIPWPTLITTPSGPMLIGFDGTPAGGPLLGYGTHGDLVVQRPASA